MFPQLRRFALPLEQEFRRNHLGRAVPYGRITMGLGAFLFLIFHWWDLTLDPARSDTTLIFRFMMAGYLVIILSLSWHQFFYKWYQTIVTVSCYFASLIVFYILAMLNGGLLYGVGGMMLALIFTLGFTRLLFWPAVICGTLQVLSFNIMAPLHGLAISFLVIHDFFLVSTAAIGFSGSYLAEKQARTEFLLQKEFEQAQEKVELLVRDVFPERIASRLRAGEHVIAESHGEASVLFADLVGFTQLTKRVSPNHLLEILNDIFSLLDELTERHNVEKIKTIGDAYMVVSGVGSDARDSVERIADFALDVLLTIEQYAKQMITL